MIFQQTECMLSCNKFRYSHLSREVSQNEIDMVKR